MTTLLPFRRRSSFPNTQIREGEWSSVYTCGWIKIIKYVYNLGKLVFKNLKFYYKSLGWRGSWGGGWSCSGGYEGRGCHWGLLWGFCYFGCLKFCILNVLSIFLIVLCYLYFMLSSFTNLNIKCMSIFFHLKYLLLIIEITLRLCMTKHGCSYFFL